ncbi:MAG: hypothetical protein J1F06_05960 [Prevotellaceae bacterium]|nr:hypothetical protein [Prevotellaceae bacterium]
MADELFCDAAVVRADGAGLKGVVGKKAACAVTAVAFTAAFPAVGLCER